MRFAMRTFPLMALLLVGPGATGCSSHHGKYSQNSQAPGQQEGLQVSGNGSVEVPPDIARVRFGVMERGATATEASNAVQSKMQAVLAALAKAQVPAQQVQTNRLYLRENPQYRYRKREMIQSGLKPQDPNAPKPPEKPDTERYIAQHTVSVELRDLGKVGAVLAAVQNAGVNEIDGVSFELEDQSEAIAKARNKAIENAQQSARRIAEHAGVVLGPLVFISTSADQGSFGGRQEMGGMMMMGARHKSAEEAPVQPGKLSFEAQVYLRYEIVGQRPAVAKQSQPVQSVPQGGQ